MSKPVKFAYVGCGFVGQTIHIPNFRNLRADCDFVGLAEVRTGLRDSVAKRYGIPKVYASHHEIAADPEIEAVGVSAAFALQGQIAQDLVAAGKHVFMEKPMAVTVERARQIVAAQSSGGRIMVAYMKRYDPGNVLVKNRIDAWRNSGEAGNFMLARAHGFGGNWLYASDPNVAYQHDDTPMPGAPADKPEWLPQKRYKSYLGYLQQWTHNVNLLRWFLATADNPSPPAVVKNVDLNSDGMTGVVVLEINGCRAILESGYSKHHAWDEHTQVYFEGGHIRTDAPPLMQKNTPATCEIYQAPSNGRAATRTHEQPEPNWSYRAEAQAFLQAVRDGTSFDSSADDTLHDVRCFEDIYRMFVGSGG
jgi:predicted dehydrogenase